MIRVTVSGGVELVGFSKNGRVKCIREREHLLAVSNAYQILIYRHRIQSYRLSLCIRVVLTVNEPPNNEFRSC